MWFWTIELIIVFSLCSTVPGDSSVTFHRTQDASYFPGPPSQPVAIETKDTSIMLSWQPNSNSGASPVFAYIVEYFSHETKDVSMGGNMRTLELLQVLEN